MKSVRVFLAACFVIALGCMVYAQNNAVLLPPSSQSAIDFRLTLRALWQYQVTWTRSYIVSVISDLDDTDPVERKLVKNQEQIGNAIKPYYGGWAGNKLAALLKEHIIIAVEIIRAAKAKDAGALEKAQEQGRKNADAIAGLLNRAGNPLWNKQSLQDVFYKHLEYVNLQVNCRLKGDWDAEISAYDDGLEHVLLLSDLLAKGVVQQFPEKFKQ